MSGYVSSGTMRAFLACRSVILSLTNLPAVFPWRFCAGQKRQKRPLDANLSASGPQSIPQVFDADPRLAVGPILSQSARE